MKVAIVDSFNNETSSWINYCTANNIDYCIVDPYDSNVVSKVKDCDVFMWHHSQTNYKDLLFAKQLLFSMQQAGKVVYPDFYSNWHFDDKLGQKYLLEAVGVPFVQSYVFYEKKEALEWAARTSYPKVFKLRGGAASTNVRLVYSYKECRSHINKAFGKGFASSDIDFSLKDFLTGRSKLAISKIYRLFNKPKNSNFIKKEIGYVYFQDFMPNNDFDTRVIVIGQHYACAERRINREGDFRASGSGRFSYEDVDPKIVEVAFEAAKRLKMQSVAFDFVYDEDKQPRIIEICFGFGVKGIIHSPGYYTDDMEWHACNNVPVFEWIIKSVLSNSNTQL